SRVGSHALRATASIAPIRPALALVKQTDPVTANPGGYQPDRALRLRIAIP
ncbi:MAG: hypothetical protein RLZZ366_928, partial [Pseudomonadota bacterium]